MHAFTASGTAGRLSQANNKLVVIRCGSVLLAVDQHAADERVQLEALQQQLAQQMEAAAQQQGPTAAAAAAAATDASGAVSVPLLRHQTLQTAQLLGLSLQEARALELYETQVGLSYSAHKCHPAIFCYNTTGSVCCADDDL